jgi:hypothetical protein
MKKVFMALMCMASLAIVTACGGGNANNETEATADDNAAQVTENNENESESEAVAEGEAINEADAVGKTEENKRVVIKYEGSDLGFCDLKINAARQYLIIEGFKADGKIDEWKEKCRTWYFFDDEATYDAAVKLYSEKMGKNGIKEQNRTSLYFVGIGLKDRDWDTYKKIVADVEGKHIPGNMIDTEHPENYGLVK